MNHHAPQRYVGDFMCCKFTYHVATARPSQVKGKTSSKSTQTKRRHVLKQQLRVALILGVTMLRKTMLAMLVRQAPDGLQRTRLPSHRKYIRDCSVVQ